MHTDDPQSASQLQEENATLRRAVEELSILNELARAIGGLADSGEVIRIIVRRSLRAVRAEQGVVTLVDRSNRDILKTFVRTADTQNEDQDFHFSQDLLGWMQIYKAPLLINDPATDMRFKTSTWDASVRTLLSVPLLIRSELLGVLTVYNKKDDGSFSPEDQRLLAIIAAQSAQVIENARLQEEEKALSRFRTEMEHAATIQRDLLPVRPPAIEGYDIDGRMIPAQMVGGDYYDYFPLDDGRIGLVIADVSGKGIPAALFMAVCRTLLHASAREHHSPADCLSSMNSALTSANTTLMFATMFYAVLDPASGRLEYSSAGHNLPLLVRREGSVQFVPRTEGMMLGFLDDVEFTQHAVDLSPGDALILYTDGVTEAMDNCDEQYGERRLESLLRPLPSPSASGILDHILRDVQKHAGLTPQSDDITLMGVVRKR